MVLASDRLARCAVDIVRRLSLLVVFGASLWWSGHARAQCPPSGCESGYEYTGKVNLEIGQGSAKVPSTEFWYTAGNYGAPVGAHYPLGSEAAALNEWGDMVSGGVTQPTGSCTGFPVKRVKTGVTVGNHTVQYNEYQCWQGNWALWTTGSWVAYYHTEVVYRCPEDYFEGTGGLCWPRQCPAVVPGDPNQLSWFPMNSPDSDWCRRTVQVSCVSPQRVNGAGTACECPTGKVGSVGNLGIWQPYWGSVTWATDTTPTRPATMCVSEGGTSGCTMEVDAVSWNGSTASAAGDTFTGATCTPGAGETGGEQTGKCPVGKVVGVINGYSVCVEGGTTETKNPTKTETSVKTNPDGSTEETTTTDESVTTCAGGNCTTTHTITKTTVTKDPQGNTTGTTTETGTKTGPGSGSGSGDGDGEGEEGAESSFGGSCPSFTCEGDAVQCAIAQEQHKRNCEVLTDAGGLSRAEAVAAFDEARTFDSSQLNNPQVAFGSLSSAGFLGGGCVQDQTFNVHGYSFTIPFASLCTYLQAAGLAFLAVCTVIAFGIVRKGVEA